MAKENGPMSGFRDLFADQMIPRDQVLGTIKDVYEGYGFVPLKTPALERYETLAGKYGEEGEKLIYRFKDNGGRDVAMRYDQTVPLARVVAQYSGRLPMPYKRYALGDVWRGERPQSGRYREFAQFDADTVGTSSYLADAEIIAMMSDAMMALDLKTLIRVNDRVLLDALAQKCNLETEGEFRRLVGIIDKVDKIGATAVGDEVESSFGRDRAKVVNKFIGVEGTNERKLDSIVELLNLEKAETAVTSLRKILGTLGLAGYSEPNIVFDPTVARGLDYYTGTIYETTLTDLPSIGSVCSGGRFDNLIEQLGGPSLPAVGTSIGVDRLMEGMRQLGKIEQSKTTTKVFIANLDADLEADCFVLAHRLRQANIPAEVHFDVANLGKQIKAVDKLGVRYLVIYGGTEKEKQIVQVKDLSDGSQVTVPFEEFSDKINNLFLPPANG